MGEACGTDDMAVSEVRHTAVTNSKNSVSGIDFLDSKTIITIYDLDVCNYCCYPGDSRVGVL